MTAHTLGRDPECRYARLPQHACVNSKGDPVRPGQDCFAESHQQVIEQGRVIHAAEGAIP